jgi:hypothetical protein
MIEDRQADHREHGKRPSRDPKKGRFHMRLIHSRSDGNKAADDRPSMDLFDAAPFWISPFVARDCFAPGPLNEWETETAKKS